MAIIRGGTIGLRIESGRWRGEPRERRICQSCNTNEIEIILSDSMFTEPSMPHTVNTG